MIASIKKEIIMRKNYLNNNTVDSIYFGGGTPSILTYQEVSLLLKTINDNFKINHEAEITLECNPDDLNREKLIKLKSVGVNRLSIGVQSFKDSDLKFMNRSHNTKQAVESILLAKKIGFKNITIDLIYGLPNQSNKSWCDNLKIMFDLNIEHFSAYALTIEPKTALKHLIEKEKVIPIDEEVAIKHFKSLMKLAEKNNYIHYEISNFSKQGFQSNHNSSYWKNKHYLGIGPSAHSYNGNSRQWNVSSNKKYIDAITSGNNCFEIENLKKEQQYNEYIFTNLRTMWGVDLDYIKICFGEQAQRYFTKEINTWINQKKIKQENSVFILTNHGKIYADAIASSLFIV